MAVDLKGEDECGIIQRRINSSSTNDFVVFDNSGNSSSTSRRLDLTTREGRLQTFFDWPPSHPIQPLDLAEAGFYYSGRKMLTQIYSDLLKTQFYSLLTFTQIYSNLLNFTQYYSLQEEVMMLYVLFAEMASKNLKLMMIHGLNMQFGILNAIT